MRKAIIEKLKKLDACEDAIEWCRGFTSAQGAWDACCDRSWMMWLLAVAGATAANPTLASARSFVSVIRAHRVFASNPRSRLWKVSHSP